MTTKETTFKIAGGKTGVLLLHGLCGTPAEMRFVAMGLARAGYTVHCPQLAGHGNRTEGGNSTWQDWYGSAVEALDELREECDTVIVGGLCMGSILGLHMAANLPKKVQGVALFSPTLWINGWAMPWYTKMFNLVSTRWLANLFHLPDAKSLGIKCPRVREFVRAALASGGNEMGTAGTPGGMVFEHKRAVKAAMKLLNTIKQPTLIVHSRQDDHADLNNATYLQGALGGSVDMCVLEDSYHMITLDKERHVVVERTNAFIGRVVEQVAAATRRDTTVSQFRRPAGRTTQMRVVASQAA